MMRRAIPWFLLLVAWSSSAAAQSARDRAIEHFREGVAHLSDGEPVAAIEDLEEARALYPTASIHFNLGLAYRAVGRLRAGIDAVERFLTAVGANGDEARAAEARRYLRTLRASLGEVRLDIVPRDAALSLDGEPVPRGTRELRLDPGEHQLQVEAPGHVSAGERFTVEAGRERLVQVVLASATHLGTVALDVTPDGAAVVVDGRPLGTGDRVLTLEVGRHEVLAEYRGDETTQAVEVLEDREVGLALTVRSTRRRRIVLAVVLSVLVAGGAAATLGYFAANPRREDPLPTQLGTVTTALGRTR